MEKFKIFFKGSKTYFTSSLFFPKEVRKDVFTLYAFVRLADNFLDQSSQDKAGFNNFVRKYKKALSGKESGDKVIMDFIELQKRKEIKQEWADAFLDAMSQDIRKSKYKDISETIDYIYGSAEVIGLMMTKIMNLPKDSYKSAKLLGRAMQYANFLRDVDEDNNLNRQYIPIASLKKHNLKSLAKDEVLKSKTNFISLMQEEIKRYKNWQKGAESGFRYIPKRLLVAVKTASDMYVWTIKQIEKDPLSIYQKKIKPSRYKVISTAIKNFITL